MVTVFLPCDLQELYSTFMSLEFIVQIFDCLCISLDVRKWEVSSMESHGYYFYDKEWEKVVSGLSRE